MKTITVVILLFISFCIISCKKEYFNPNTFSVVTYTFAADALEFVTIPVNKYFIYKDSASGITDSVIVVKNEVVNKFQGSTPCTGICWPGPSGYSYQEFSLTLKKINPPSAIWFNGKASNFSINFFLDSITGINMMDSLMPYCNIWYPLSDFDEYTHLPAYIVEGITYSDVHLFSRNNGMQPGQPNYLQIDTYWVKGTGIVQRRIIRQGAVATTLLIRTG